MNKWLEIIIGLVLVVGMILIGYFSWAGSPAGAWTAWDTNFDFLHSAWIVLKGGIFWFVLGIGALFILLGISDLKE